MPQFSHLQDTGAAGTYLLRVLTGGVEVAAVVGHPSTHHRAESHGRRLVSAVTPAPGPGPHWALGQFYKYLLSIYFVPIAKLGIENTAVKKTQFQPLEEVALGGLGAESREERAHPVRVLLLPVAMALGTRQPQPGRCLRSPLRSDTP
ncbi:unnamed protein product [Rangifer tarandus platyrhynchus]|uniref:Uncharacterized protein n=1 Tax=Rangifer tarandus platyrhynchus TaxID=3082113 RepID=A0AC59YH09_RANTA